LRVVSSPPRKKSRFGGFLSLIAAPYFRDDINSDGTSIVVGYLLDHQRYGLS